jgi:hypothetical protein
MPKIDQSFDGFDGGSLHYPTDLGVGFTHPDCVKISIGTNPGVSLGPLTTQVKGIAKAGQSSRIDALKVELTELKSSATKEIPLTKKIEELTAEIKKLKVRFNGGKGNLSIGLNDVTSIAEEAFSGGVGKLKEGLENLRKGQKQNTFTFINSIYLPMPENLVYNEPIDWTGTDLGMMKGAADALLGKGGSDNALAGAALGQAGNVLAGGAGAIVSKLLGGGLLGGAVLGGLGGGASLQGAIESNLRVKSNPFKEQTFQGVGFRPFEFSFVFNARSQTEVNTIRKIINTFRKFSKPSLESPESAIFNYPAEFQIEFLTLFQDGWTDNEYLPRLKQCVCKSVNTNFTTAGWKSFEEGAPTTITLQLGFEETDIITNSDVKIEGDGN